VFDEIWELSMFTLPPLMRIPPPDPAVFDEIWELSMFTLPLLM